MLRIVCLKLKEKLITPNTADWSRVVRQRLSQNRRFVLSLVKIIQAVYRLGRLFYLTRLRVCGKYLLVAKAKNHFKHGMWRTWLHYIIAGQSSWQLARLISQRSWVQVPPTAIQVVLTCFGFHSLHLCKSLSFGFADFLLKNPFEIYTRVAKWRRHLVHTEAYIGSNPIFGIMLVSPRGLAVDL